MNVCLRDSNYIRFTSNNLHWSTRITHEKILTLNQILFQYFRKQFCWIRKYLKF